MDSTYRGWNLSGSVSAGRNAVEASAEPSISGLEDFTETYAWIGQANAVVRVSACIAFRLKWLSQTYYNKLTFDKASAVSSGELRAKVVVGSRAWGSAQVKIKSDPDKKLKLSAPIPEFGEIVGSEINFQGNIYIRVGPILVTYNVEGPVDLSRVQKCGLKGVPEAAKKAKVTNFWFGTQSIAAGVQVSDTSNRKTIRMDMQNTCRRNHDFMYTKGSLGWRRIRVR